MALDLGKGGVIFLNSYFNKNCIIIIILNIYLYKYYYEGAGFTKLMNISNRAVN